MVEVRLAEPALDLGRDGPRLLGGAVGGGQGLGPRRQAIEGRALDGIAGLDDDDARLGARRDRLRQGAEQVGLAVRAGGAGRGAHDDEVGPLGLAQDRVADVRGLLEERLAAALEVLLDERGQGVLGLGPHGHRDARRDEVEDDDRRVVVAGDGVGVAQGELGVRAAADRDEDALDRPRAALLDDGDVARGVADDLVDGRREDRRPGLVARAGLAAPAEDDEVRFLLGGRLDDALGGMAADPDERVDRRAARGVVEDALEQPAGMAGPGRALGQRHPLGDLHDAERRQLAVARVQHGRADAGPAPRPSWGWRPG